LVGKYPRRDDNGSVEQDQGYFSGLIPTFYLMYIICCLVQNNIGTTAFVTH